MRRFVIQAVGRCGWMAAVLAMALTLHGRRGEAAVLLVHYDFDEASSGTTTALDTGASPAANGTFSGSSTRTAGLPNSRTAIGALDTNGGGTTSYLTTGTTPAEINGLTTFTLTTWVDLQGNPANFDRLISMHGTSNAGFDFFLEDYGVVGFGETKFKLALTVDGTASRSSTIDVPSGWIFLAVTYDGGLNANNVKYYWGSEDQAVTAAGTVSLNMGPVASTTADLRIGGTARTTQNRTPDAFFDDVRIYSGVMSQSELEAVRDIFIPEPTTVSLLFGGLSVLWALRRKRLS